MMKLYIDPGHGGADSGALGNGLKEKDLTLKISLKIRDILNDYNGIDIKLSRETDKTLSLKQRTDDANKWSADFLLSVHINAGGGEGYEDFIYDKLSNTSHTANKRNIVHDEIVSAVDFKNRGKKKANFHMLRESKMNAMLTENGFIDNKEDAKKLKSDSYLAQIAYGHAMGIVKAYGLKKKTTSKPSVNTKVTYQVVAGSFSNYENAETQVQKLKGKGIQSFIQAKKL